MSQLSLTASPSLRAEGWEGGRRAFHPPGAAPGQQGKAVCLGEFVCLRGNVYAVGVCFPP